MTGISIRPAVEADGPAIARIHYDALQLFHDFYAAFFAINPRESIPQGITRAMQDPKFKFLVATDNLSGPPVGFIRYNIGNAQFAMEDAKSPESGTDHKDEKETLPSLFARKPHMERLWKGFNEREGAMDALYEEATGGREHIFVNHLMVDPNHQRKGIGRALLASVIQEADRLGIDTYIISSREAHGLYEELGFETLRTWILDNGFWAKEIEKHEEELGMEGQGLATKFDGVQEVESCMIRRAKKI